MKPASHPTALKLQAQLHDAGVQTRVVEFSTPTRTSAEAAAAIACDVAQIAKSVVFKGAQSGGLIVVVASGANRVSEAKVAALVGEDLARADAAFVKAATGYVIGGVAPIGHAQAARMLLDESLQTLGTLWAAGGTPNSVFAVSAADLARITGAPWADVREPAA